MRADSTVHNQSLEAQDLSEFADGFFAEKMRTLKVPGAALVIVQGDEILHLRGYGMANQDTGMTVDAHTLFRAGSVSKLFTATAVMQLVEAGLVDPNTDVNQYLKSFQLETRFPQPVTVADLLLHTAGFDEHYLGGHARTPEDGQPLSVYLANHMPPQTAPAGTFISYNDHTMALAGLVVEEVSGMPFDHYVEENIFQPLGMDESTFTQPAPDALLERLAVGYALASDSFQPFAYDYINVGPAAALLTSVNDMAGFLSAHLTDGGVLMKPDTLMDMHTTHFRHHELLRGRAYGFSEIFINGQRVLFHDGGNPGFGNRLMIMPEEGLGFFLTFNIDQFDPGGKLHREFTAAFFDRYFPDNQEYSPPEPAPMSVESGRYTGYYREMQAYSSQTIQKLTSLLNQFPVRTTDDDALFTTGSTLIPVEPNVFARSDIDSYVVFKEDAEGGISHMFFGTGAFVKMKWYESQPFQLALVAIFLLTFLGALIAGLTPAAGRASALFRPLLSVTGLLNLVFLIGLGFLMMQTSQWEFTYGIPVGVKWLLAIPFVSLLATSMLGAAMYFAWQGSDFTGTMRIFLLFFLLVSVGYYFFLNYWNILGWRG